MDGQQANGGEQIMLQSQWDTMQQAASAGSARAGKLAGLSEAFAERRQGKDDKLGTDDGSDEAFLEQAKLRAQRLYEIIHLAKTAMLRNPMKRPWTPSPRPEGLRGMHS